VSNLDRPTQQACLIIVVEPISLKRDSQGKILLFVE
jgi:hypothetical protein